MSAKSWLNELERIADTAHHRIGATLAYFDNYRTARLPQNMMQAQRGAFDAHTYQRVDDPGDDFLHCNWLD